jgi:formyltetrahydrofolate-dependent phosphoribosylglycinamide formyltransferase
MLERLQQKWKVGGFQLILILCTFAIGGSLTGWLGKKIMNLLAIDNRVVWIIIYIVIITLIWPVAVLTVSVLFGQFRFFTGYLKKMGDRIAGKKLKVSAGSPSEKSQKAEQDIQSASKVLSSPVRIAVFASGAGSNAQKIIDYFRNNPAIQIGLIVCNKPGAGVLGIAERERIPSLLIEKERFFRGNGYVDELQAHGIGFIVLAGFLWKIPSTLIDAYPSRIVNIHPALLPAYGGKGMYGNFVHEAVLNAKENESGITIHYVDGHYDNGDIIFQARCPVHETDTAATLAGRIHQLEHAHYPRVIESIVAKLQ